MSEENVDVVRRAFEAYSRGDIDEVLRLCDEDIVIIQAPEVPGAPPRHDGHAGVLEAFGLWPAQWDDYRVEIRRVLADPGDYVVVGTHQSGRGKESGVEVQADFTFVFAVRNGRIAEWRIFVRESDGLAAVGLGE